MVVGNDLNEYLKDKNSRGTVYGVFTQSRWDERAQGMVPAFQFSIGLVLWKWSAVGVSVTDS